MTRIPASKRKISQFTSLFSKDKLTEEQLDGLEMKSRKTIFIYEINERNQGEDNIHPYTGRIKYEDGEWKSYDKDGNYINTFDLEVLKHYVVDKRFVSQIYQSLF